MITKVILYNSSHEGRQYWIVRESITPQYHTWLHEEACHSVWSAESSSGVESASIDA